MHRDSRDTTDDLLRRQTSEENRGQRPPFANDRHTTTDGSAAAAGEGISQEAESDTYSYYSAHDYFSDRNSVSSSLSGHETATDQKTDEPHQWWRQANEDALSLAEKETTLRSHEQNEVTEAATSNNTGVELPASDEGVEATVSDGCEIELPLDDRTVEDQDASGQISPGIEFIMNRTRQRTISQSVEAPNDQSEGPTIHRRRPSSWHCESYTCMSSPNTPTTGRYDDPSAIPENSSFDEAKQDLNLVAAGCGRREESRPVPVPSQRFSLPIDMGRARERLLPSKQTPWLPFPRDNHNNQSYTIFGRDDFDADQQNNWIASLNRDSLIQPNESKSPPKQSATSSTEGGDGWYTDKYGWSDGSGRTMVHDRDNERKGNEETALPGSSTSSANAAESPEAYNENIKQDTEKNVEEDTGRFSVRETVGNRSGVVKKMIKMFSYNGCKDFRSSLPLERSTDRRKGANDKKAQKMGPEVRAAASTEPVIRRRFAGQQAAKQYKHSAPQRDVSGTQTSSAKVASQKTSDKQASTAGIKTAGSPPGVRNKTADLTTVVQNVGWLNDVLRFDIDLTCQHSGDLDSVGSGWASDVVKVIPIIRDGPAAGSRPNICKQGVSSEVATSDSQETQPDKVIAKNTVRICAVPSADRDIKSLSASRPTVPMTTNASVSSFMLAIDDRQGVSSRNVLLRPTRSRRQHCSLPFGDKPELHVGRSNHKENAINEERSKHVSILSVNGLEDDKARATSLDHHKKAPQQCKQLEPDKNAHNIRYTKFTETHIRWAYYRNSWAVMVDNAVSCRVTGFEDSSKAGSRSIVSSRTAFLQKEVNVQDCPNKASCSSFLIAYNGRPEDARHQWEPRDVRKNLADSRHRAETVHTVLPRRQSWILSTSSMNV